MTDDRTGNGRFAKGNTAASKAKRATGSDDVVAFAGYVIDHERQPDLVGPQRWVTYSNAFSRPPVAIRAILQHSLLSGLKWSVVENEAGGTDATRGAELVQAGLIDARLPVPWGEVVARAAMSWFFGSSLHATAMGRRPDGSIAYTDIAHRPMHTIDKWLRKNDQVPFDAVEQSTRDGKSYIIPLAECLYLVEKMLSDDPYGVGVLRLVVERIRRAGAYEKLEGAEMFSSMAGTPIYRAPLEEINAQARQAADPTAYREAKLAAIKGAVENRIKTPERQMYLGLDSAPYTGTDPNTITSTPKWGIEVLKGELQGLADIRKVISDLDLDIARILGVEWVLVGGNDGAGSYGMHESKVGMFQSSLQALANRIANRATMQLARRLVAANGLDPETACPYLVPEKLSSTAVLDAVAALEGLSRAGLHPEDPAHDLIRERLELPPRPMEAIQEALMAPRGQVTEEPEDEDELADADEEPSDE